MGNAYFSLTIHALPAAWRRLAIVTSAFHMPRSEALFCDVYAMAGEQLFQDPARRAPPGPPAAALGWLHAARALSRARGVCWCRPAGVWVPPPAAGSSRSLPQPDRPPLPPPAPPALSARAARPCLAVSLPHARLAVRCRFQLTFVASSDEGVFDEYVLQARHEKEAQALANWQATRAAAGLTSLSAFHAWFYGDHLCYSVGKQHLFGVRTIKDERLLASY